MEKKLIKLNFKNELSSKSIRVLSYQIMIDRIRILKSLTCTTSVLEKKKKESFSCSIFKGFFFYLHIRLIYYTRIYYARKMCLLIKDSACGLCKTRFLPLSSGIRGHD